MNRIQQMAAVLVLMATIAGSVSAGPTLTGSLSAGAGITGLNPTANPWLIDSPATTMTWWVTDNENGTFTYKYILTVPRKEISHIIIQVSPNFGSSEFTVIQGAALLDSYGPDTQGNSNPGMPDLMKGLKTNSGGLSYTLEFVCNRVPVWGDFYAKDGRDSGYDVAIWNAGFTANDNDPTAAPSNGSVNYHILVPDSVCPPPAVPAPAAIGLGSLGMIVVGLLRRRNAI